MIWMDHCDLGSADQSSFFYPPFPAPQMPALLLPMVWPLHGFLLSLEHSSPASSPILPGYDGYSFILLFLQDAPHTPRYQLCPLNPLYSTMYLSFPRIYKSL